MKLQTKNRERRKIRTVAERWDKAYGPAFDLQIINKRSTKEISELLHALDVETATADDVAEIIGNGSWVAQQICCECNTTTTDAAGFGYNKDSMSAAWVCAKCMRLALCKLDARRKRSNKRLKHDA